MSDKPDSLAESLRLELSEVKDIELFRDPKYKKAFIDKVQTKTEAKRNSIEATFSTVFKQRVKTEGKELSDYSKKSPKKYSSKLDIQVNDKSVETNESTNLPNAKNPKVQQTKDGQVLPDFPMASIAGSIDVFFRAFVDNLDPLSKDEKEDAGACLNMCLGGVLTDNTKARAVFGFAGLVGIYGGRIRQARKTTKKEKAELAVKEKAELPVITHTDEKAFNENATKYLEKEVTDT